jgi:thioesterase domain-containing protein
MTINATELETIFKNEIPISNALGIRVLSLTESQAILEMPLGPNVNHKGTLLGGSLYSACAFACYGIFLACLRGQKIETNDIVISKGEIQYKAPVNHDCRITAGFASTNERDVFFETLRLKNKSRLKMTAQIHVNQILCAEFTGQFVAILPTQK